MIRDRIVAYLSRMSDYPILSRARARIILGTDRKTTRDSGYGDGGENDVESATIDLVAGFAPDSGDNDLKNDKSRIYISQKTDPDDYFDISVGDSISGEPAIINISDHIRIKGRKTIKIVGKDFSIIVNEQGDATVDCRKITVSCDETTIDCNKMVISCPDIRLGSENASETPAWASKVQSELQKIQTTLNTGALTTTGAVVFSTQYVAPTSNSQIGATKTKIE